MYEVGGSHHLGNAVLDLDPRVHFDEVELSVGREQKLDRADIGVANDLRRAHRSLAHFFAQALGHYGAWRFFEDLLMAPLDRAVALAEMDDVAIVVGQDLEFDVARMLEVLLEIHGARAESGFGSPRGPAKKFAQFAAHRAQRAYPCHRRRRPL